MNGKKSRSSSRPISSIIHTASDRTKRIMASLKLKQDILNDISDCSSSKCTELTKEYKSRKVGYTQKLDARKRNWKLDRPLKKEANEINSSNLKPVEMEENTDEEMKGELCPKDMLCKLCFNAPFNTAFLECGHSVSCSKCAEKLHHCPICRKVIKRVVQIFIS